MLDKARTSQPGQAEPGELQVVVIGSGHEAAFCWAGLRGGRGWHTLSGP